MLQGARRGAQLHVRCALVRKHAGRGCLAGCPAGVLLNATKIGREPTLIYSDLHLETSPCWDLTIAGEHGHGYGHVEKRLPAALAGVHGDSRAAARPRDCTQMNY